MMDRTKRVVKLARSTLDCSCHACAFFHSRHEEYQVLVPFLKDGLEAGDKAFHIVDKTYRAERVSRLEANGVDTTAAEQAGQLEVRTWESAYLRDGRFDQQAMLALIEEVLNAGKQQGFGLTRLWANMEWALEELPGVRGIRDAAELHSAEIRRRRGLHLRPDEVQRVRGDGHSAHPSAGDCRRDIAGEPLLRAAGRVPARTE